MLRSHCGLLRFNILRNHSAEYETAVQVLTSNWPINPTAIICTLCTRKSVLPRSKTCADLLFSMIVRSIPSPDTAFSAARDINKNSDQITIGNTVLHEAGGS